MKKALPVFIIGIIGIILLDSLGSIASRQFNFNYGNLIIIGWPFTTIIAYFIAKRTDKKITLTYLSLLGLFDSTVGWTISTFLKANTGLIHVRIHPTAILITICIVIIMYSLFGLLGWWLAKKTSKR